MGRADSNTLKARKAIHSDNHHLQLALEAYTYEQSKPKEKRHSLRDIAHQFNVKKSTLNRRYHGHISMSAFNALKQKVPPTDEDILVEYVLGCSDHGLPLTHPQLASHANSLLEARFGSKYQPVGKNWSDRFVKRHYNQLQMHWSKPLDSKQARAMNPHIVKHWFKLIKEFIHDKNILPHNIYGMDESGFPPSVAGWQRVVGRRGNRIQHKQGGADRENVTAIVTICADGTALEPTIIFKDINFMKKWGENNVSHAS